VAPGSVITGFRESSRPLHLNTTAQNAQMDSRLLAINLVSQAAIQPYQSKPGVKKKLVAGRLSV